MTVRVIIRTKFTVTPHPHKIKQEIRSIGETLDFS